MPRDNKIKSILLIGSGPIVIGQACEFDYSGSQAARSLREEGIEVSLINSNPATIMTDPVMADHIYLRPLTVDSIIEILEERQIDAVLPTMGGQTALNLCIEADKKGVWKKYGVKIIGVDIDAINITEDREQFKQLMQTINIDCAPSKTATSYLEGKAIAQDFGFPLCIRASFTLGGTGAAFVHEAKDFEKMLKRGMAASPIHEVIIDKALLGWKEYELELLRDKNTMTFAGRLIKDKNVETIIDAYSKSLKLNTNLKLDIYGDGIWKDFLEKYAKNSCPNGKIIFHGQTDQKILSKKLHQSNIFVFASKKKGEILPNALKEAMYAGCICITTRTPGVESLINNGVNGFIEDNNANDISSIFNWVLEQGWLHRTLICLR